MRYAAGERDFPKLAREYGVTRQALANAVLGQTYKTLPMPPNSGLRLLR